MGDCGSMPRRRKNDRPLTNARLRVLLEQEKCTSYKLRLKAYNMQKQLHSEELRALRKRLKEEFTENKALRKEYKLQEKVKALLQKRLDEVWEELEKLRKERPGKIRLKLDCAWGLYSHKHHIISKDDKNKK